MRQSGVLMHISSLFGDYSIGSFSDEAYKFIDFLSDCKFKIWQVLPFCMADECNSPYKSYSSFAGNPYFVDLTALYREGLLTENELNEAKQNTPYYCEFDRLSKERLKLLLTASRRVGDKSKIESFINGNKYLCDFCKFMALKEKNQGKAWQEWSCDEFDTDIFFMWEFIEYKFFEQWKKIKAYANSKGIKIIGDIPFYVSIDSSDVWGNKHLFMLDENNNSSSVAGVPPDYFSADGQLWGNPLYNWDEMAKDGYGWWCDRLKNMFTLFDGVRIDHFRAIESFWSVDASEKTAKNGHWIKGPGKAFIDRIKEIRGDNLVIAEDLGDITDAVRELVDYSGFPSMRVLQFGFLDDGDSIHKPHNYNANTFAYTGTHDNNTLLGYVWGMDNVSRKRLLDYCGFEGTDFDKSYDCILRTMFRSSAGTLILPIQDLLLYGEDTRLNIPGKAEGNWSYRITLDQLNTIDKNKFRRFNEIYNR